MRAQRAFLSVVITTACSSSLPRLPQKQTGPEWVVPVHFAERESAEPDATAGPTAKSPNNSSVVAAPPATVGQEPAPQKAVYSELPDPEALRTPEQWQYTVELDHGRLRVLGVERRSLQNPLVTARKMGRYAIELWIGKELIERVRFDFPLANAEAPPRGKRQPLHEPPSFLLGTRAVQRVLVPASARATRAVLVDCAVGVIEALPWPPDNPLAPATDKPLGQ